MREVGPIRRRIRWGDWCVETNLDPHLFVKLNIDQMRLSAVRSAQEGRAMVRRKFRVLISWGRCCVFLLTASMSPGYCPAIVLHHSLAWLSIGSRLPGLRSLVDPVDLSSCKSEGGYYSKVGKGRTKG